MNRDNEAEMYARAEEDVYKRQVLSGGTPGSHRIQGIGAGFIPEVLRRELIDEVIPVEDEDAFSTAKCIAQIEGIHAVSYTHL